MSLGQLIKKMAQESHDSENPLQFIEGEVHKAPPNMQIKLKGNAKLVIPSDFVRVSEHLTKHKRRVNGGDMEFTDELKKGDKVMIAAIQGGQSFFIIDRFKKG